MIQIKIPIQSLSEDYIINIFQLIREYTLKGRINLSLGHSFLHIFTGLFLIHKFYKEKFNSIDCSEKLLIVAWILHDIGRDSTKDCETDDHTQRGSELADDLLSASLINLLNLSKNDKFKILDAIKNHQKINLDDNFTQLTGLLILIDIIAFQDLIKNKTFILDRLILAKVGELHSSLIQNISPSVTGYGVENSSATSQLNEKLKQSFDNVEIIKNKYPQFSEIAEHANRTLKEISYTYFSKIGRTKYLIKHLVVHNGFLLKNFRLLLKYKSLKAFLFAFLIWEDFSYLSHIYMEVYGELPLPALVKTHRELMADDFNNPLFLNLISHAIG